MAKKSKKTVDTNSEYDGLDDKDIFSGRLDRVFHVVRLSPEDEQVLRDHFAKFETRHKALLALVPLIEAMDKKKPQPPKRKAMRLGLPKAFIAAAKKLKRPMTQALIDATRQFSAQHPNDVGSAVHHSDDVTE